MPKKNVFLLKGNDISRNLTLQRNETRTVKAVKISIKIKECFHIFSFLKMISYFKILYSVYNLKEFFKSWWNFFKNTLFIYLFIHLERHACTHKHTHILFRENLFFELLSHPQYACKSQGWGRWKLFTGIQSISTTVVTATKIFSRHGLPWTVYIYRTI